MPTIELLAEIEFLKQRAERAESDIAALKKDARLLATWAGSKDEINAAVDRIIEATKVEP